MTKNLILGSSSSYRRALLKRLNLSFECQSPDIDETAFAHEIPSELVKRLTIQKAKAIQTSRMNQHSLIITSDQIAVLKNDILGKPHTMQNAMKQLSSFSAQKVTFLTGLCVLDSATGQYQYHLSDYHVFFRELSPKEIENYINIDQPLDCAGSFKCEGLGVTLFEKMEGDDPNSLIGLPLIQLCKMLREHGINPLLP